MVWVDKHEGFAAIWPFLFWIEERERVCEREREPFCLSPLWRPTFKMTFIFKKANVSELSVFTCNL